MYLHHCH